jgi:hypothetical protein
MNIDRLVMGTAGAMTLISLFLSWVHSPFWLGLTVFVGANLLQAAITGFCPSAKLFKLLGVKPGRAFE